MKADSGDEFDDDVGYEAGKEIQAASGAELKRLEGRPDARLKKLPPLLLVLERPEGRPGPGCSGCHGRTGGRATGHTGARCTALPGSWRARGGISATADGSFVFLPGRADGGDEFCDDVVSGAEKAVWRADKAVLEARVRSLEATGARKDRVLAVGEEALQCPVCLEVPRGAPVLACTNGHLVCASCNTEACSLCR